MSVQAYAWSASMLVPPCDQALRAPLFSPAEQAQPRLAAGAGLHYTRTHSGVVTQHLIWRHNWGGSLNSFYRKHARCHPRHDQQSMHLDGARARRPRRVSREPRRQTPVAPAPAHAQTCSRGSLSSHATRDGADESESSLREPPNPPPRTPPAPHAPHGPSPHAQYNIVIGIYFITKFPSQTQTKGNTPLGLHLY